MTEPTNIHLAPLGLSAGFSEAGAEIARVAREEIAPAAALIEGAFASAARAIERDLSRAARSGSLSLKGLAQSILNDLKRVAIDSFIRKPIENLFLSAFGVKSGGRAAGGFVAAGEAFLVGERGPELFTPSVSGRIGAAGAAPINVAIHLTGVQTPENFRASETQIAASLSRVLARGARNQ
jgi:phage-related minor tail protein